ncbi:Cof-type HAD-IIB family hydrolase [Enterococcus durans]|uniref:Cof-type HAD-IIB family hydrolase n=1 Tax=Enterococcus durans TaxID=53345 RepID=A0A5N0YUJ2_9ENTE|nr:MULTISPECIES: Cof-type HAD-IIB family hydrolase [Enterococcus]KAA9179335.1 Cof-type HAD-IIB family hydrolase [Enterococcus durans]KAA9185761.1 Cof-type HAD-IIB family hydrolase [Enterococcus durans]KAA9186524.1 Cof-type HAD-IIB family hydrolase [Enterococcus durans]KAA9190162.1 Cof-type HAD-IIB family hydrolase [Enterococcus durans]KAA9190966.1 Cof-type HAD-IIB family hydrolase [Enterococcus durans]
MIKLILTDLDGTFLDSKGSFDKELYEQVKGSMDEQAIYFAPCTGKQCERVEELFGPELSKDLWILGDSATRIKHNNEYVYESLLPNNLGIKLINKLEEIANDYTIIACTPTAAMIKETTSEEDKQMVRGSYREVQLVEALHKITEDFVKITVYDRKKRCFEYVKELMEFKEQAYIVASEAAWIDISNAGVHKGTTVKELQKLLGVTKEETMAFGDGLNDIELLNAATYSFAMGNAFEETKAAANFITRSNDEQGVLQTIQKIIALQK